ncbi:MAG: hypothetical protein J6S67_04645 [Methanobrevibacter sp.]|nr:hypothetical protein [Methanobrevibacter sp.]
MKKITLTAIKKAVNNHYGLNELKEVKRSDTKITFAKGTTSLITFEIIGADRRFVGWYIEGYTSYIVCEWLNDVVKVLEK